MSLDEEHPDDEGEEFEEQPEAYFEGEDVDDVVDTPNEKLLRTSRIDVAEQPESYRNNTQKEELLLQYVANFRRQFEDLYPKRKPLMLCPRNECGMRKFICTSVRPTQVPFIELYDYDKCAAFVADFIKYEQLELPIALPQHMPSPTAVIEWQAGDCFDMAQVRKSPRHAPRRRRRRHTAWRRALLGLTAAAAPAAVALLAAARGRVRCVRRERVRASRHHHPRPERDRLPHDGGRGEEGGGEAGADQVQGAPDEEPRVQLPQVAGGQEGGRGRGGAAGGRRGQRGHRADRGAGTGPRAPRGTRAPAPRPRSPRCWSLG